MTATTQATDALTAFQWEPQPKAAAFVRKVVDDFLEKLPEVKAFAHRLYRETGNRFVDQVAEIHLGDEAAKDLLDLAREAGWAPREEASDDRTSTYWNSNGIFPAVMTSPDLPEDEEELDPEGLYPQITLLLRIESVGDFVAVHPGLDDFIPEAFNHVRPLTYAVNEDCQLVVLETHGTRLSTDPLKHPRFSPNRYYAAWDSFRGRGRECSTNDDAFDELERLVKHHVRELGRDLTCEVFFAAEREYWQRRNTAAQFQKARQDKLGIGWANHDHHTYRSSRRHFHRLVGLWEKLGFECRERFYPGPEAGWGAQVMEQPVCGIVTFNDVDISEDEMLTDFAHEPMEDRTADNGGLATVGLWCALHGESVLQAGMHHLECTFDFAALEEQMKTEAGIETMPKFTDFPHLKQAFTKGERWQVDPRRIDALLDKRLITEHQAKEFRKNGAIGSHLENLERNDGFKGFNQTGVTDIIKRTDPRRQTGTATF